MKMTAITIALAVTATSGMAAPVYLACEGQMKFFPVPEFSGPKEQSFVVDLSDGTIIDEGDVLRINARTETSVMAFKTKLEANGTYTLLTVQVDRVSGKVKQQVWQTAAPAEAVYDPPFDDGLDVKYRPFMDTQFDCTVSDRKF